jgi:3'-phosphoadenosine 5'-phosphosulfate sulfotransferase (PAPS reductase)/FAD synthetase
MNIVSFSGGKDSTAMLLMMLDKGIEIDRIICVDTTKEFPAMYQHIQKVQDMIAPLIIEVIKIDFDYWFANRVLSRGKRAGESGYGWPDMRNRWCTRLKMDAFTSALHGNDFNTNKWPSVKGRALNNKLYTQFLGIAYDERNRVQSSWQNERNVRYPLVEWKITESQALEYCYSKGLDWNGLYKQFNRVSCYCCPLSQIGELRTLYNTFPDLWSKLLEMDKKSFRKFRSDYSVLQLTKKFFSELSLF